MPIYDYFMLDNYYDKHHNHLEKVLLDQIFMIMIWIVFLKLDDVSTSRLEDV